METTYIASILTPLEIIISLLKSIVKADRRSRNSSFASRGLGQN